MFGFLKNTFRKSENKSTEVKNLTIETCLTTDKGLTVEKLSTTDIGLTMGFCLTTDDSLTVDTRLTTLEGSSTDNSSTVDRLTTDNSLKTELCLTTDDSLTIDTRLTTREGSTTETAVSTPSSEYFEVTSTLSRDSEIHSQSLISNQRPSQPISNESEIPQVALSNTTTVYHNTTSETLMPSEITSNSSQNISNNTSHRASNTSQNGPNTSQKVSNTSQNLSGSNLISTTTKKISNTLQKTSITSQRASNTSQKASNTSQKVSCTSQNLSESNLTSKTTKKVSDTSRRVSYTSQKTSNTSHKASNTAQKASNTSQKSPKSSQKASNTSQKASNTSQKASNSSQTASNTSQFSNTTLTISNTSQNFSEAPMPASPHSVDVIYKLVNDHVHASSESVVNLEYLKEISSNSSTNQMAALPSPKFMRHIKLPILNILNTFKRSKPHDTLQTVSHHNKLSSKTISSEPTINRKKSENNISFDSLNSTFLSVPTLPPNTTELPESIKMLPGVPHCQKSPRHYVYQDGDPTLYFPTEEFSSSCENVTRGSLTEREFMSYASVIRSQHSALSSLSDSEYSREAIETPSTTDDTYYDNMFEGRSTTSISSRRNATEKHSSVNEVTKDSVAIDINLDEKNSKRYNLDYNTSLGNASGHYVKEKKKSGKAQTRKQNFAIEYYDGGKDRPTNEIANEKGVSKTLMTVQRNNKSRLISEINEATYQKRRSHNDMTHTSKLRLVDHSNSCPNNFHTIDVVEKTSVELIPRTSPKRSFFDIEYEHPFDNMVSTPSSPKRRDTLHQSTVQAKSPFKADQRSSMNFDSNASSHSIIKTSVGSSTRTLVPNKSQTLLFASNSCSRSQKLRAITHSLMEDVSNHSLSNSQSGGKTNSYLQIKKSKKSVSNIPKITKYSSDALKEVLNRSKENMSRYTSRVLHMSTGNVPSPSADMPHKPKKPDQARLYKSRCIPSSKSSEVHCECEKSSPEVIHNSSVNVLSNNRSPYPRYFKLKGPVVLSTSREDTTEVLPEKFCNYRSPVPFREGLLTLNSSPEISKLDQLLDHLEQTSLSENNVLYNHPEPPLITFTVDKGSYGDEAMLRRVDDEGEEISYAQWLDGLHDYYSNVAVMNELNGNQEIISSGSINSVRNNNIDDGIPIVRSTTYTVLDYRYPLSKVNQVDELDNLPMHFEFCFDGTETVSEIDEQMADTFSMEENVDESSEGDMVEKEAREKGIKLITSISSDSIFSTRTYSLGTNLEYLSNRENCFNDYSDDYDNDYVNVEWKSNRSTETVNDPDEENTRVEFGDIEDLYNSKNCLGKITLGQVSRKNVEYLNNPKTNIRELDEQILNSQRDKNCTHFSDEFVDYPENENWGLEWSKWDAAKKKRYARYMAKKGCTSDYDADTESIVTSNGVESCASGSHVVVVEGDRDEDDDCVELTRKGTYTLIQRNDD